MKLRDRFKIAAAAFGLGLGSRAPMLAAAPVHDATLHASPPPALARIVRREAAARWLMPSLAALTPQYIEQIMRSAMWGDHGRQWELFDLMLDTWPELAACAQELTDGVSCLKMVFDPFAEEDEDATPDAIERCKLVSGALRRMAPDAAADENDLEGTVNDIIDGWFRGVTALEIEWQTIRSGALGSIIAPRATFWVHPKNFGFDQTGRLGLRMAGDRGQGSGVSADSRLLTPDSSSIAPFPEHKFLTGIHKAKAGQALGGALLRPLAWWWCAANFSADWLLNLAQIFGLPFRWANYDPAAPQETVDRICAMLQNMGSAGWAAFPAGTTLELKDAGKTGDHSPQGELLDRADRYARMLILGQTMSGSQDAGKGGGKAFGSVESDVKATRIEAAGRYVCRVLNTQLLPSILALNYGDAEACPKVRLLRDETGGVERAQTLQILKTLGLDLSKSELRAEFDLNAPGDLEDTIAGGEPAAAQTEIPQKETKGAKPEAAKPDAGKEPAQDAAAMKAGDASGKDDGHWVTVNGRHLHITGGQSVEEALHHAKHEDAHDEHDKSTPSLVTLRDRGGKATTLKVEHDGEDWIVKNSEGTAIPGKKFHSRAAAKKWTEEKVGAEIHRRYDEKIAKHKTGAERGERPDLAMKVTSDLSAKLAAICEIGDDAIFARELAEFAKGFDPDEPGDAQVTCSHCGTQFDSASQPEVSMGAVACPGCGRHTDQNGNASFTPLPSVKKEAISARDVSGEPRDADGEWTAGGGSPKPEVKSQKFIGAKRTGEGKEAKLVTEDGADVPAHIAALKLPPAWTDVKINPDPRGDLLAQGRDKKGRVQSVYSDSHNMRQAAAKFSRIRELAQKHEAIAAQNEGNLQHENPATREAAAALKLIHQTGIRPGSDTDTMAKVKAYGATTLEGRHVVEGEGGAVRLQFTGKKGVALDIPVNDPATANMLRARKVAAGDTGKLFRTDDAALRDYTHTMDGGSFKPKDFRTLKGTSTAAEEIAKRPAPRDEKEYQKAVKEVAKVVSAKLGNTPTVALQSYIDPHVFHAWRMAA